MQNAFLRLFHANRTVATQLQHEVPSTYIFRSTKAHQLEIKNL